MKELTSRERLHRCYFHEEVDRPAVYLRWVGMERGGGDVGDPSYNDLKKLIIERTDRKAAYSVGHLLSPLPQENVREPYNENFDRETTTLTTPKGPLTKKMLISLKIYPGYCEEHFLKNEEDAERYLSLPFPEVSGDCSDFPELVSRMGDDGIVHTSISPNPASIIVELFGSETFAILSMENRPLLHRMTERECEFKLKLVRFLLDHGVGPFFTMGGEEYLVPPLHGRKDFYDFNVKYDKPICDLIHEAGGRVHIHSHGSIKTVCDGFVEFGTDVLHPFEAPPMGDITPAEAKEAARGKMTLEGNLQVGDLHTKDEEEMREQVRGLIRDVFDDGRGLIICPTASPYIVGEGEKYTRNCEAVVDEVDRVCG